MGTARAELVRELPRQAWEQFLSDADGTALVAALRSLPTRGPLRDVGYPEYHRLCDVELCGSAYRVSRLVDPDDGRERLFISPTDHPDYHARGVPYWLQGAALARW